MNLANITREHDLLGCIIHDNRVLEEYAISSKLFTTPFTRAVFENIEKAIARGVVVDLHEIAMCMPGPMAAQVATLTDAFSAANVKTYVDELQELARRRGIAKLARVIGAMATETETTAEILDHVDHALLEIADSQVEGYKHVAHYLKQATEEIQAASARKGALSGIPTGFSGLDERTNGWQNGEVTVVGARPGTGKTSLMLNFSTAAIKAGFSSGIFSAEMSGASLCKRLYADWAAVEHSKLRSGYLHASDIQSIMDAAGNLVATKLFINDTPAIKLRDLITEARKMKRKEGIQIVFIDYLSLVTHFNPNIPKHERIGEISKALKQLARELNIPVVVLSQMTRDSQNTRPNLAQLRDSGAVEEDADIVILLHHLGYNDEQRQQVKINMIVEKGRNIEIGDIPMMFRPSRMRFGEVDEPWKQEETKKTR